MQTYGDWQTISVKQLTTEEVEQQETALEKAKYDDLITEEESRKRIEKELLDNMIEEDNEDVDTLNTFNPHGGDTYKGVNIKSMKETTLEDLSDVPVMKEETEGVKIEFKKKNKKREIHRRNKGDDE